MTDATLKALDGLRDLSMLKWYVIPLMSFVFYVYTKEIKDARRSGNWNAVLAGLTILGVDFFNETWNSWVLVFSGRSAFWTAPGDTALTLSTKATTAERACSTLIAHLADRRRRHSVKQHP